ncbi:MAG: hypothetical protein GWN87_33575 [Desulfuromonadales bacterium]|nr:hypothetical protein [Desulfuromonadales bacterium]
MKKFVSVLLVAMFALSLAGCGKLSKQEEEVRVKCPACGYEFNAPAQD